MKEAQEEEENLSKVSDVNTKVPTVIQGPRILSFKEKKVRPSMSLQKNLSLITAIA